MRQTHPIHSISLQLLHGWSRCKRLSPFSLSSLETSSLRMANPYSTQTYNPLPHMKQRGLLNGVSR